MCAMVMAMATKEGGAAAWQGSDRRFIFAAQGGREVLSEAQPEGKRASEAAAAH